MFKSIVNIIENIVSLIDYLKEEKAKRDLRRQGRDALRLAILQREQIITDKLKGIEERSKKESEREENRSLYADKD